MNHLKPNYVWDTVALWKDNVPITGPSEFRQLVVAYDEPSSIPERFRLYVLSGSSDGVVNGEFSIRRDSFDLVSDECLLGLDRATQRAEELTGIYREQGFRKLNMMDNIDIWRAESAVASRNS